MIKIKLIEEEHKSHVQSCHCAWGSEPYKLINRQRQAWLCFLVDLLCDWHKYSFCCFDINNHHMLHSIQIYNNFMICYYVSVWRVWPDKSVEIVNDTDLRGLDPAQSLKLETCLTSRQALFLEWKEFPVKDDSHLIIGFQAGGNLESH